MNSPIISLACHIPVSTQDKLIALVSETYTYDSCPQMDQVKECCEAGRLTREQVVELVGLYTYVLKIFMESDEKEFKNIMLTAGFNAAFVETFLLKQYTNAVSLSATDGGIQKLSSFLWRVDISYTRGVLENEVQVPPKIMVRLLLSNDYKYIFEIDLCTFNRLRYNVALAFKEFNMLKHSNVFRTKIKL